MLSQINGRKLSNREMKQVLGGGTHICFDDNGRRYDVVINGNTGDFLDRNPSLSWCLPSQADQ
ncbi:MAG: hypothetical protein WBA74_24405 [Cyclobacteriaceae bacterium]